MKRFLLHLGLIPLPLNPDPPLSRGIEKSSGLAGNWVFAPSTKKAFVSSRFARRDRYAMCTIVTTGPRVSRLRNVREKSRSFYRFLSLSFSFLRTVLLLLFPSFFLLLLIYFLFFIFLYSFLFSLSLFLSFGLKQH